MWETAVALGAGRRPMPERRNVVQACRKWNFALGEDGEDPGGRGEGGGGTYMTVTA